MKKLSLIILCLFLVNCATSNKPKTARPILKEYLPYLKNMSPACQIVKLQYPDSIISELPEHLRFVFDFSGKELQIFVVDIKKGVILGIVKLKDVNLNLKSYYRLPGYNRHFCVDKK